MGKRARRRGVADAPGAGASTYRHEEHGELVLRGAMTVRARRRYAETLHGGRSVDDAWQQATELLFEQLAASWTTATGEVYGEPRELLGRYRFASREERSWIRDVLRRHLAEHFPEMETP